MYFTVQSGSIWSDLKTWDCHKYASAEMNIAAVLWSLSKIKIGIDIDIKDKSFHWIWNIFTLHNGRSHRHLNIFGISQKFWAWWYIYKFRPICSFEWKSDEKFENNSEKDIDELIGTMKEALKSISLKSKQKN